MQAHKGTTLRLQLAVEDRSGPCACATAARPKAVTDTCACCRGPAVPAASCWNKPHCSCTAAQSDAAKTATDAPQAPRARCHATRRPTADSTGTTAWCHTWQRAAALAGAAACGPLAAAAAVGVKVEAAPPHRIFYPLVVILILQDMSTLMFAMVHAGNAKKHADWLFDSRLLVRFRRSCRTRVSPAWRTHRAA